ncbi:HTH-type transcriptional regulator MalT [Baekduia alba]|uniref:LuxR C-terminal-related transcriptional regulator n=1 Tax=Baekduia alba TaxID=2997333 RepID=UPI00234078FB|nr:LuxR C-terminal-related transcriptional regulator [Baekduia alba]WCB94428.1 HTH-type transcriptional regulator MalT [Baekduia alba]
MGDIHSATEGSAISLHRAPIARTDLVARLGEAVGAGGIAVLAAEPGTGKTEVLAQWRAAAPARLPVVAVDGAAPRTWAAGLRSVREHAAGTEAVLLVDHADRLPPAYLGLLGDALVDRGRGLGVVLSGRRDPGLCLIELRRTGPVEELSGEDLAWSAADVADAFARWGRPLRDADAADLTWRTDGWAAAVRLAALVGPQVLDADTGPLRDYVLGPALADVPEDLISAALRLALADEVDEVIAELLARPSGGAAALLQTLRLRRLFVRPAGDGDALRFHRLFAQVARRELSARDPSTVNELRRRLRRHLGAGTTGALPPTGPPSAVVDAAMEDDLLAAHAVELLLEGVLDRPSPAALAALPRATPAGRAAAALGLLVAGDLATAEQVLDLDAAPDAGAVPGDVLAVAVLLRHRRRGDRAALAAAAEALPVGGDADRGRRALAFLELGLLDHDLNDLAAGEEHLQLAISLAEGAGRPALTARARAGLALLSASAGRLRDATRLAEAATAGTIAAPRDARVRAALARSEVALLRDDIVDARAWAARARAAAGGTDDLTLWLDVLFWEIATLDALGDDDAASARLAEARDIARRAAYPGVYATALEIYRGRLLERDGRVAEARRVLDRLDPALDPTVAITYASRQLRAGAPDGALAAVGPWLAHDASSVASLRIWLLVLHAVALGQLGDDDQAHASLEQALAVAEPEGMRRPFADESVRIGPLLRAHQAHGTAHAGFVVELLDRIGGARPAPEGELRAPLTDRERVVLGFLPAAMTATDIADALIVSEATVRTHLRHIYAKLGVSGRREAVRRARDLRLLSPEDA